MSGGLDSSLCAAFLKESGWEVFGLHMRLPAPGSTEKRRLESVERVAEFLSIPLEVEDLRDRFTRKVVDPFVDAYLRGETPNPCVVCNSEIKFASLRRYARKLGIHYLSTGHYARIRREEDGSYSLCRGRDREKEQSYFLHRLEPDVLPRIVLPLGDWTREEVVRAAREKDLPVSIEESQEICFLSGQDYREFIEEQHGLLDRAEGGRIVDALGNEFGRHQGLHGFTVGQRKGLGVASARPYYVREIRPDSNELVIGRREELYTREVEAKEFHWLISEGHSDSGIEAQVRYRHRASSGRLIRLEPKAVRFLFDQPQWAVTPGQALVCYRDERVLGGGWIRRKRWNRSTHS